LHGGRIQRQHHHFHSVIVHLTQSVVLDIEQSAAQFFPVVTRDKAGRVLQRLGNGEMFFQPYLADHIFVLVAQRHGALHRTALVGLER
jgi:hypothetical protein